MLKLSNPRNSAIIEDWPTGRKRCTATFTVETKKGKYRVSRVTTGKPKKTTYNHRMCIVDGDDGRTYLIAITMYDQAIVMLGTLTSTQHYFKETNPEMYQQVRDLLNTESLYQ